MSAAGPVGFVGLGNMGRRMAANLAAAGFPLVVRDSDDGAQQRFVAGHGGEPAASPRSFAEAGVVVTMLPDSAAVREAILGWEGGIAAALKPGAVVLDMSSSDPVGTKALASTVSLSSQNWGTVIDLRCVCLAPVYAHHDRLAMIVVNRDGTHTQLATWVADPGHTATPAGSISTPVGEIASVQVVSADNGKVLLERSL